MHMRNELRRFFIAFLSTLTCSLSLAFAINFYIDPLWHRSLQTSNNKLNFYNERVSKANEFMRNSDKYDCVIFGSSRVTLLDQRKIKGFRCFNFSFSGGRVEEFLAYAKYLKKIGFTPRLVIIGVDGSNFFRRSSQSDIPEFISRGESPPSIIKNYLSLSVLNFSVQSLLGKREFSPGYYHLIDGEHIKKLRKNIAEYQPVILKKNEKRQPKIERYLYYKQIHNLFSEARYIYYVPPLSYWYITNIMINEELNDYLNGIHSLLQFADVVYDFSLPSTETMKTSNTYDGSHYSVLTNDSIIESFNSGRAVFGLKLDRSFSIGNYQRAYEKALSSDMAIKAQKILSK